jgi:hypothetical protein
MKPSIKAKPSTQHMLTPARDLPFGAGHEQAKHVMDQTPTTYMQNNSDVRKILQKQTLQKVLDLTKIGRVQHERRAQLARNHPLGEGHEQARSEYKEKQDNTQTTTTGQYTHSTLLKSSNRPMAAARRRQGQQLDAWHGTPSRRPQAAPPFPLTPAGEVIQPLPPVLLPEAWPCKCNTNKAKHPKRDKVFLNTTHC